MHWYGRTAAKSIDSHQRYVGARLQNVLPKFNSLKFNSLYLRSQIYTSDICAAHYFLHVYLSALVPVLPVHDVDQALSILAAIPPSQVDLQHIECAFHILNAKSRDMWRDYSIWSIP